jgi:hypothetical protein
MTQFYALRFLTVKSVQMLFFTRFQPFKRVVKRVINGIYFFSGRLWYIFKKFNGKNFKHQASI